MSLPDRIHNFLDRAIVRNAILGVILFNAILLGLETSKTMQDMFGPVLWLLDTACLTIFVIEIGLKLIAYRFSFFKSGWNIFDLLIVGISLVPSAGGLSVLRALRILRLLRVVSVAPSLRRVVEGFVTALPGMGSVFILMAIIFYIGAVMATKLFGTAYPEWFGTLGQSGYSLFQIMTLESWSMGIVRPVMEQYPYAWAFFIPFIMVTTFAVVNLLVGLIVNSMQDVASEEGDAATSRHRDELMERLKAIEEKLSKLD